MPGRRKRRVSARIDVLGVLDQEIQAFSTALISASQNAPEVWRRVEVLPVLVANSAATSRPSAPRAACGNAGSGVGEPRTAVRPGIRLRAGARARESGPDSRRSSGECG